MPGAAPIACSRPALMREVNDSPPRVIRGKPDLMASMATRSALYGKVSRNRSASAAWLGNLSGVGAVKINRAGSMPAMIARMRRLSRDQVLSAVSHSTEPAVRRRMSIQAANICSVILLGPEKQQKTKRSSGRPAAARDIGRVASTGSAGWAAEAGWADVGGWGGRGEAGGRGE